LRFQQERNTSQFPSVIATVMPARFYSLFESSHPFGELLKTVSPPLRSKDPPESISSLADLSEGEDVVIELEGEAGASPLKETPRSSTKALECVSAQARNRKYKTELCSTYLRGETCRFGALCNFAHGFSDLRRPGSHPRHKTEKCKYFHGLSKSCPFGTRCTYLH
jgi:hypothetical protein